MRRAAAAVMLRALPRGGSSAASVAEECTPFALGGVRYASQLAVKQRMRSVTNIQKITMAMKMVAASKMRVAQAATEQSRGLVEPFLRLLGDLPDTDVENNLTVAISSDKGLCGGVNSSVSKYTRAVVAAEASGEGKKSTMVVIGEKGKAQLARGASAANIVATVADYGKVRVTFSQVSAIAGLILAKEYDVCRLVYNRFISAISYKATVATVLSPDTLEKAAEAGGALDAYEVEGPDRAELLQSMAEFQLGATIYNAFLESFVSEQSARMAAMESSSKNAKDLIGKLTLSYNRTRQAAITTELTEIVSGAAALEG